MATSLVATIELSHLPFRKARVGPASRYAKPASRTLRDARRERDDFFAGAASDEYYPWNTRDIELAVDHTLTKVKPFSILYMLPKNCKLWAKQVIDYLLSDHSLLTLQQAREKYTMVSKTYFADVRSGRRKHSTVVPVQEIVATNLPLRSDHFTGDHPTGLLFPDADFQTYTADDDAAGSELVGELADDEAWAHTELIKVMIMNLWEPPQPPKEKRSLDPSVGKTLAIGGRSARRRAALERCHPELPSAATRAVGRDHDPYARGIAPALRAHRRLRPLRQPAARGVMERHQITRSSR
jgi:hypothetical protein